MSDTRSARPSLLRRFVGRPRIWVAVLWCGIGLAWILLAVGEGPSAMRITLGAIWLLLGLLQGGVALADRKNERGFYHRGPRPAPEDDAQ